MSSPPRSLTDHITLWVRWRWFLITVVFLTALVTLIVSLLLPKTYRSTASVLPPFEGGPALPFLGGLSLDIYGVNEVPASGLVTLLKSRSLKDRVNDRVDLVKHYEKEDVERAYEAFEDHLEIEIESEESFGVINIIAIGISVLDRDPEFCARLVNIVVNEWDELYTEISRRSAGLRRQYVEENLFKTSEDLAVAEDSLRTFQEKYGIASLDAQVAGTVTALIELEQKIINARVSVKVLEKFFQSGHPELQRARLELQELEKEQKKLQEPSSEATLLLPLDTAPEVGLTYARLYRRVATLEAIHTLLIQQYEQAKMQELKDTPALRILDRGAVPLYKYKPKRAMLVVMATASTLFLALLLVYFLDYVSRTKGTEEYSWIEDILKQLRSDLHRIIPFGKNRRV